MAAVRLGVWGGRGKAGSREGGRDGAGRGDRRLLFAGRPYHPLGGAGLSDYSVAAVSGGHCHITGLLGGREKVGSYRNFETFIEAPKHTELSVYFQFKGKSIA